MRRDLGAAAALCTLITCGGCADTMFFTIGKDPQICEDNIPTACGATARCVLDGDHYLEGRFPGARRFIVRTGGEADIDFQLFLDDRRAPGTVLQLQISEPNCSDKSVYDSAGRDIFRDTGDEGVLHAPLHVSLPGDHLVELMSDAYCSYLLKFDM